VNGNPSPPQRLLQKCPSVSLKDVWGKDLRSGFSPSPRAGLHSENVRGVQSSLTGNVRTQKAGFHPAGAPTRHRRAPRGFFNRPVEGPGKVPAPYGKTGGSPPNFSPRKALGKPSPRLGSRPPVPNGFLAPRGAAGPEENGGDGLHPSRSPPAKSGEVLVFPGPKPESTGNFISLGGAGGTQTSVPCLTPWSQGTFFWRLAKRSLPILGSGENKSQFQRRRKALSGGKFGPW